MDSRFSLWGAHPFPPWPPKPFVSVLLGGAAGVIKAPNHWPLVGEMTAAAQPKHSALYVWVWGQSRGSRDHGRRDNFVVGFEGRGMGDTLSCTVWNILQPGREPNCVHHQDSQGPACR